MDVANRIGDNFNSESTKKDLPYSDALKALTAIPKGLVVNDNEVIQKYLMGDIVVPEFYSVFSSPDKINLIQG